MRKVIFTIMLLGSLVCSAQPILLGVTGRDEKILSDVLEFLTPELDLTEAQMEVVVSPGRFNKDMSDRALNGAVEKIGDYVYVINMSDALMAETMIHVFIHEMVHVSQVYHGRLVIRKRYVWYDGKVSYSGTPPEARWYEIEAQDKSDELFFKYKQYKRNKK